MDPMLLIKCCIIFIWTKFRDVYSNEMFPMDPNIAELTPLNFEQLVIQSHDLWIVEFYAPWCVYCKKLVPELKKTAAALKGSVKVGALNADKYTEIGEKYGVTHFPTIKIFGYYKSHPQDFKEARTSASFVSSALKAVQRKVYIQFEEYEFISSAGPDIVLLDDSNFDSFVFHSEEMWLVKFYAPWSNLSKNFLPHWRQAATKLRGAAKFGIIDASLHSRKAQEYQIEGFPTVKAFVPYRSAPYDYYGNRNANSLIEWALDKLESFHNLDKTIMQRKIQPEHGTNVTSRLGNNHDDEL